VLTGQRTERGIEKYRGFIRDTHGDLTVFDVTSEASAITITSVTPIVNGATKTMTIKGRFFGTYPPPMGEFQGMISLWETGNFTCGDDATPTYEKSDRLRVTRWTDTQIDIAGFSWPSKSVCHYLPGDKVDVGVWNAQNGAGPANFALTVGTASQDLTPPKITSVTPVYPRADQTFIIRGQGFGSAPKQYDSEYLMIWDDTAGWLTTSRIWDPALPIAHELSTIRIARWTPNEIVVSGFGGAYGLRQWTLNGGDKIEISVTNPDTGVGPAKYETTVVGTGENLVAPVISSVSKISARGDQTITIEGKGFGSRPPTTQVDETTPFLMITDETGNWQAGRLGANTMSVFLSVSQWTDTKIVVNRFTGAYSGERQLRSGNRIKIQVWDAQTGAGPAEYRLTVDGTASPAVSSGAPYIVETRINPNSSSIQLASGLMYLYGMSNGGARPSQPFITGQFAEAVNAYHNLAAALAYSESEQNRYPTTTWSHDICGVAVAGRWNRFVRFYGVNAEPGASSAAVTFNVVENSFVVIIGLAGGQTDITLSGVPGMQIDRSNKDSGAETGIVVAHATLTTGRYTITELSSDLSHSDAESKADLIGVFVFGENE
jgi:protein involved in polysaccharide export with SLBB domain